MHGDGRERERMMRAAFKVALLVAVFAIAGCHTCCHHRHGRGGGGGAADAAYPVQYASQRCQVPNVIGLDHDAAEAAVFGAHLKPVCIPGHAGTCGAQRPAPGTWLTCNEIVELTFVTEYQKVKEGSPK